MMRHSIGRSLLILLSLSLAPIAAQDAPERPGFLRYRVIPEKSAAGFDGKSTLHDFTGRTQEVGGEVRFNRDLVGATAGGRITVAAKSLDTGDAGRDREMRKHLAVEQFPDIRFELDGLTIAAEKGGSKAHGRFAIHGIERAREFAGTVAETPDGGLHLVGDLRFKMTDHGIEPPSVAVITVDDEVHVFADILLGRVQAPDVAGEVIDVDISETLTPVEGVETVRTRKERLWRAGEITLWTRADSGSIVIGRKGGRSILDFARGEVAEIEGAAEDAFADSEKARDALEKRIAAMPEARRSALPAKVAETRRRLAAAHAIAPAAGALVRAPKDGGGESWKIGDVGWAEFDGATVAPDGGRVLAALEGLPAAVRSALGERAAVPAHAVIRTATPAGVRTIKMAFSAPKKALVPEWLADPADWTTASKEKKSW